MAAYRKNVPLRQSSGVFRLEDGTMCRMPSPLPGPLRGEFESEPAGLTSNLADGLLPLPHAEEAFAQNAASPALGKAA